jgi:hypothetical protein
MDTNPEKPILQNFYLILDQLKQNIINTNSDLLYNLGYTEGISNNYFIEDKDKINIELFLLSEQLTKLTHSIHKISQNINNKMDYLCNHCWIEDLIDINENYSKTIVYCKYCNVSKSTF